MEILECYAHLYVKAMHMITGSAWRLQNDSNVNLDAVLGLLQGELETFGPLCRQTELENTADLVDQVLLVLTNPTLQAITTPQGVADRLIALQSLFVGELSHKLFFQLPANRKAFFAKPREGWEDVIDRFGDTVTDIEEMRKCFALSRYAACVYHSVQVIEHGLLRLGEFLHISDPNSGWTAVAKSLKRIVDTPHDKRSTLEQKHFKFIEQIQGTVEALKNAWRNKISHAQGRLTLLSSDFTPDVAEEIMMASRGFMRRLAADLPNQT